MIDLNLVWFILVGILLAGYALLDGFDLGVGSVHLFHKAEQHRQVMLGSIHPVWDGNEVWLITGGGALFAAFPEVYATIFSGFYIPLMLVLCGLIFRAAAIEFRSKETFGWWRKMWDTVFSITSILVSLLLGVALGNIIWGVPIAKDHEFAGTFFGLLNPYALLVGVMTLTLFMMHGTLYGLMKTEGELQASLRSRLKLILTLFIFCYLAVSIVTFVYVPKMLQNMQSCRALFAVPVLTILAIVGIPVTLSKGRNGIAFLCSCIVIVCLMTLFAIGIFPNIVPSNPNPENSLTIYNAASSAKTLQIMLIIALVGMPLVIGYTSLIYWIFRGKAKASEY